MEELYRCAEAGKGGKSGLVTSASGTLDFVFIASGIV